jgi:hypothetical protein
MELLLLRIRIRESIGRWRNAEIRVAAQAGQTNANYWFARIECDSEKPLLPGIFRCRNSLAAREPIASAIGGTWVWLDQKRVGADRMLRRIIKGYAGGKDTMGKWEVKREVGRICIFFK